LMAIGIGGVVVLLLVIYVFVVPLLRRKAKPRDFKPFLNIVLFRAAPARHSQADLRAALKRAYGQNWSLQQSWSDSSDTESYAVAHPEVGAIGVMCTGKPYFSGDDLAIALGNFEDQRVQDALRTHSSCTSVMAFQDRDLTPDELMRAYSVLGRLVAELYDRNCVLLFQPTDALIALPGPEVTQQLREGRLGALFAIRPDHHEIVLLPEEDAEIQAATRTAQQRLPEFLAACEQSSPPNDGIFKARFRATNGQVEVIWLNMKGIKSGKLIGVVESDSVYPGVPAKGQTVAVACEDIEDWAYRDRATGRGVGNFSGRAVESGRR